MSPSAPVIVLRQLTKQFVGPPPLDALRAVDLDVQPGEFLTVQGRSGSGKSTLLNLLGLLDRPTSGTYELGGVETSTLGERERTWLRGTEIGFVFQSFQLLADRSAVENVMMGLLYRATPARKAREESMSALERVGLADRAMQLPSRMSGGERQRVAIARAIVGTPSVLLCDEPTGNLDTQNSDVVMEMFSELNAAGSTIVLITHDRDIAAVGDRRMFLRDGVLSEISPSDVHAR
ncbi:ABC transporter ATP-binding protein [Nocardioides sp. CPCC 206347]|uniref:ABC transporter ATP-binding protein n=1 Tax=unclassified Nocardioides TaxID=2615069 RepID=UPI0036160621